ncbi:ATP-binding protein [Mesorhizobium sp. LNJC405B00]|uniref:AAA family ATPase n=1 Tax=Mesorhizobium sp. LNJC405B00 TaxID=1287281 RepID=UPI0003CE5A40|nr:ATP-binding protein [Mesorhizobium sp. LNJC405B00]ESY01403.1 ATPase [Mesorhizobium sp. LNJC405B00]
MTPPSIFDQQLPLPSAELTAKAKTLLGFEQRYAAVHDQLQLMLRTQELPAWNKKFHHGRLDLAALVQEQYPFVIFYGDVGTGKTATAECIANRLVGEAKAEDSILFKLSNRVRGSGMVGEMGTLISQAFQDVIKTVGKQRRAILIIDEGDSLAASRSQDHSHHEDKVGVNTLIQHIDDLRKYQGRIIAILCTNRLSVLDAALQRRAAIIEEFKRPDPIARHQLFSMDLAGLDPTPSLLNRLVEMTGERPGKPGWTYSDIRTRLYPSALAKVFPQQGLTIDVLLDVAGSMAPSPVMADK